MKNKTPVTDTDKRKLAESAAWLEGQKLAFEAAMLNGTLAESLNPLIDVISVQTGGEARAAFYKIPRDGVGLHLITGMTEDYARDVNGFAVGPESLACGLAMHTGEPVITPDVEEEPRWTPFLAMARKHHYRGCWSFPLRTDGGPVLGTMAMYYKQPRVPDEQDLEMAHMLSYTAAIIISRHNELDERTHAEMHLQQLRNRLEEEVKEHTAQLKESKDLLQGTLDSTPDMIQVFKAVRDAKGKIIDFVWILNNHASEHYYGNILHKRLLEITPGVLDEGIFQHFVEVTETGISQRYVKHYVHEQFNGWFYQSVVKLGDGVATSTADITALREAEEQIKQLEADKQREVFRVSLSTLEEERHRISENLHNGLGQILYGIKISLSGLNLQLPWAEFKETKNYTDKLLNDAILETRRISHQLMPTTLEEFGLKAAIQDICQQLSDGVTFHCQFNGGKVKLDKYLQLAIYRTVQELMINVVKHAGATEAQIIVTVTKAHILIRVSDNGRGIEIAKHTKTGIGLAAIRSKINLLNGTVNISNNNGAVVEVMIPLEGA